MDLATIALTTHALGGGGYHGGGYVSIGGIGLGGVLLTMLTVLPSRLRHPARAAVGVWVPQRGRVPRLTPDHPRAPAGGHVRLAIGGWVTRFARSRSRAAPGAIQAGIGSQAGTVTAADRRAHRRSRSHRRAHRARGAYGTTALAVVRRPCGPCARARPWRLAGPGRWPWRGRSAVQRSSGRPSDSRTAGRSGRGSSSGRGRGWSGGA